MAAATTATAAPDTTVTPVPLTVLITGANRGIGLAVAEAYAKQVLPSGAPAVRVIATARDPLARNGSADALQALAKAYKNVQIVALDVSEAKSVGGLPQALAALQPALKGIDVLINNAGIVQASRSGSGSGSGSVVKQTAPTAQGGHPNAWAPLEHESIENWVQIYRTNVVGVWDVTQRVLPLLRTAESRNARIVNVSSLAGQFEFTIDGLFVGGAAAYRASKTALNELSAVQAREYNHTTATAQAAAAAHPTDAKLAAAAAAAVAAQPLITVLTLHPGVVETDMAVQGGFTKLPISVSTQTSAAGIIKLATDTKATPKVKFLDAITLQELKW